MAEFDPFEETFGLDFDEDEPESQSFSLDMEPAALMSEPEAQELGLGTAYQDSLGAAVNEVDSAARADDANGGGFWSQLGENKTQRILNALQIVSAGLATYASVDPAKTGAEFRKIAEARMRGKQERAHDKAMQEQRFAREKELQTDRFDFEKQAAQVEQKFRFEYQQRDSRYAMKQAFKEHGWDMDMEGERHENAVKRMNTEQKAQLQRTMVGHALDWYPEGEISGAIEWSNCAVYGKSCGSEIANSFSAGISKNIRVRRMQENVERQLDAIGVMQRLPASVQLNPMTGSPEPVPMTGSQTLSAVDRLLAGESAGNLAGTLVADAETDELMDGLSALEAKARDGDPTARAAYVRAITERAEAEGREVNDYEHVRLSRGVGGTLQELQQSGAYEGDTIKIAQSLANADFDTWIGDNEGALDLNTEDMVMRVSQHILTRAEKERWGPEETKAALRSSLTRAQNKRLIRRGVEGAKEGAINNLSQIIPYADKAYGLFQAAWQMSDMDERVDEGMELLKASQR
jgi:hypothetical protein